MFQLGSKLCQAHLFKLMAKTLDEECCLKWHQDHAQKYNMPIIQDMDGVVMIWIRSEINLQLMQSITFYISWRIFGDAKEKEC